MIDQLELITKFHKSIWILTPKIFSRYLSCYLAAQKKCKNIINIEIPCNKTEYCKCNNKCLKKEKKKITKIDCHNYFCQNSYSYCFNSQNKKFNFRKYFYGFRLSNAIKINSLIRSNNIGK